MKLALALLVLGAACGDPKPSSQPRNKDLDERDPVIAYYMVDDLEGKPVADRTVMVNGWVKEGSIARRVADDRSVTTFELTAKGKSVRVAFAGPPPDTFKDRAQIVARGKLVGGVLEATELNAKCPSKYEGATSSPVGPTKFQ